MEKKSFASKAHSVSLLYVYVLVEGTTEESFVNALLRDYFISFGVYLWPIQFSTSRKQKGGITSYSKIKRQIQLCCKQHKDAFVTTMIDYYARPGDFPGDENTLNFNDPIKSIEYLEEHFALDINHSNFLPFIVLHEFEGLLYSDPNAFGKWFKDEKTTQKLIEERKNVASPEHINQGNETAPSKRIKRHFPSYEKVSDGIQIAIEIGLNRIRKECMHFNKWLESLENLSRPKNLIYEENAANLP